MELPEPHPNLANLCRNLDRLMTVEMRISDYARDVIAKLHAAAVAENGGTPVSLAAARHVLAHAKAGRFVFIATGAGGHKHMPAGETDGPPGAIVLARAIHEATGATPLILTDDAFVANVEATALAGGLGLRSPEIAMEVRFATSVLRLAPGDGGTARAEELMRLYDPCLVVAVEKIGPAPDGIAYTAAGKPTNPGRGRAEAVFDIAAARLIPSIGIGDNGNEIGFGRIRDAVIAHKPEGAVLATRLSTDVLVPANVSNWGAYAVVAAMAALLRQPEFAHDPETEMRMLLACLATGAADGSTARHILAVDGMPAEVQTSVVIMMRQIVRNGLVSAFQRGF